MRFFAERTSLSVWTITKTLSALWRNFLASLTKLNSKYARKLFWRNLFPRKTQLFFIVFGHQAKHKRTLEEIFSAGLSKLNLRVPEKHFDWTHSLKKLIFIITSGPWEKICRLFGKRFSTEFWKSHSTCPGKHFGTFF